MNTPRLRPLSGALITLAILAFSMIGLYAVHSNGLFELGDGFGTSGSGDIIGSMSQDGCDWSDLFDADPTEEEIASAVEACGGVGATFVADQLSQGKFKDDTVFATGASKNDALIADWQWNTGSTPAKSDISNFYTYATLNDENELIIYAGLERLAASGDAHVDFEFNQGIIGLDNEPPCRNDASGGPDDGSPCEFAGEKVVNDILVVMDFEVGGTLGLLEIRQWDGASYVVMESLTSSGCNTDDTVCAFNNGAAIGGGDWPSYNSKGKVVEQIEANGFTEAGINITKILGSTPCFSTVQAKTRSSASFNSSLKDFALSGFSVCSISVTKTAAGPSGEPLSKIGDPVTYTITIENTGAGDLFLDSLLDSQLGDLTENAIGGFCAAISTGDSCAFDVVNAVPDESDDPIDSRITASYSGSAGSGVNSINASDDSQVNLFQPSVDVSVIGDDLSTAGNLVNYLITVVNTGSLDSPDLANGSINDTLLGNLLDPFNPYVTNSDCSMVLPAGGSCVITAAREVLSDDPDPLTNTVSVSYNPAGGFANVISASNSHQVDLVAPAFNLSVTAQPDSGFAGDTISYIYTLINTGDVPLDRISVTDSLLGDVSASFPLELLPGANEIVTLTRVILPDDPNPLITDVVAVYQVQGLANTVVTTTKVNVDLLTLCALSPGFWKGGEGVPKWDSPSDAVAMMAGFYTGSPFPWVDGSLGNLGYLDVLNLSAAGDVTRQLSFKYVAARLNQAVFGVPAGTAMLMAQIDMYLASHPMGSNPKGQAKNQGQALLGQLNDYFAIVGEANCPASGSF
jgi:hypothetical protein